MQRQVVLTVAILLIANLLMVPQVASAQTLAPPTQEYPPNGATDLPTTVVSWVASRNGNTLVCLANKHT